MICTDGEVRARVREHAARSSEPRMPPRSGRGYGATNDIVRAPIFVLTLLLSRRRRTEPAMRRTLGTWTRIAGRD